MTETKVFELSEWIWIKDTETENQYAEFCERLFFDGRKTVMRISARGDYAVYINGGLAFSNQFADFEHYKVYDEVDITEHLSTGENTVFILGWYFGKSGMRYNTPLPGIIYEVISDGAVVLFSNTDTPSRRSLTYVSGFSRRISPQLGYSFKYDSTLDDGAMLGGGDGFGASFKVGERAELYKRRTEKLTLCEAVYGKAVSSEGTYLFDFGRELVGLPEISFRSSAVQSVNIAYGEVLSNGHVKRRIHDRDFSFDYVAGACENRYTSPMLRFACRYIEISCESDIEIEYVSIRPQVYPIEARKYNIKNELDERIYGICLNTLRASMLEHYVDCPWREQCLYAFDARNQMLTGYTAFADGNREYARENLYLISRDRRPDNLLSICFPSAENLTIPSFSLYYIIAVREYMENTGDTSLGCEVLEKIESILGAFIGGMKDGLVLRTRGERIWNFYDWSPYCSSDIGESDGGADCIINCIAIMALEAYGKICEMAGAEPCFDVGIADGIKVAAREKFYSEKTGAFYVFDEENELPTELANGLTICSGVADGDTAASIAKRLTEGEFVPCSLSMKVFKYDALLLVDKEKYRESVLSEIRDTYKRMLDFGSTTVWEEIQGPEAFDKAGSLCHGWSAVPIHYYGLLGILE